MLLATLLILAAELLAFCYFFTICQQGHISGQFFPLANFTYFFITLCGRSFPGSFKASATASFSYVDKENKQLLTREQDIREPLLHTLTKNITEPEETEQALL